MRLVIAVLLAFVSSVGFAADPPAKAAEQQGPELTWLGHAAFKLKTAGGTVVVIDPWLQNPMNPDREALQKLGKVDFILVSHGHSDHVGNAVEIAKTTGAKLVGSFDIGSVLTQAGVPKGQAEMTTLGNVGGTIELTPELKVTLVPAVHSSTFSKDETSAPAPAGSPVGFVIHLKDGPTLYHTGDTDVFGDMKLIGDRYKIDVMLACIGGHFTMDPEAAAMATTLARPKTIVPMHYGTFPLLKGKPEDLAAALKKVKSKSQLLALQPNEAKRLAR
jgi:L-ascorbate metabolism protein UlaG (beta-lactamase superfamily)